MELKVRVDFCFQRDEADTLFPTTPAKYNLDIIYKANAEDSERQTEEGRPARDLGTQKTWR